MSGNKDILSLPAVFSDHMVFQRGKRICIFGSVSAELGAGSAEAVSPRHEVRAELINTTGECISSGVSNIHDGQWELYLPPLDASGPYTMAVSCGDARVEYSDIYIGEVWLAAGQSNMELELQASKDGEEAVKNASNDKIRYYYTPKVPYVGDELFEEEKKSAWELCDSEHVGRWSAVAYYFANVMSGQLGCVIGIIGCNWGGTSASCWVSRQALESKKATLSYVQEYDEVMKDLDIDAYIKERDEYIVYQEEFDKNLTHYYATAEHPTWDEAISLFGENKYPGPMGPRTWTRPYGLYECMLMRICPYTLGGIIFYQGCEDDHKPDTYYDLLCTYLDQVRKDFRDDTLPFMNVQLPMFCNDGEPDYKNWPLIREAQMKVYKTRKNTGLAVALDKGEYGNIHPIDKKPVGERLAAQALYHVFGIYDEKEAFGPMYRDYYVEGDVFTLTFDHVCDGFECTADNPAGFEIAGDDRVYYQADVQIEDDVIRLTSKDVKRPVYARYAWTNYSEVTVYGKNGIPLAPFRTSADDGAKATGSRNTGFFADS